MTTTITSTCVTSATSSSVLNLTKVNCNLHLATKNGSTDTEPAPPLVSIVMAVYNQERYLAQAIASVVGQTYTKKDFTLCTDAINRVFTPEIYGLSR